MKKRIIITISIILTAVILAVVLLLIIPKGKKNISLKGYNGVDTLDLGEYSIKNYKKDSFLGEYEYISFDVNDSNDFYNKIIKNNQYYKADLDFEIEGYFAYGYFVINDSLFNYKITKKNNVEIISSYFYYENLKNTGLYDMYIFAPANSYISKEAMNEEKTEFNNRDNKYSVYFNNELDFDKLLLIYSYAGDLCRIENDAIYVKGIYVDIDTNEKSISDNYIIKIYVSYNCLMVENVYE